MIDLKKLISLVAPAQSDYSRHSFGKNATQYITDYDMLDKIIQKLSQLISITFQFYFTNLLKLLYNFNFSFYKDILFAILRVVYLT